MISIDHDNFLPTKDEAELYVKESIVVDVNGEVRSARCIYSDEPYHFQKSVTNHELKEMKVLAKRKRRVCK